MKTIKIPLDFPIIFFCIGLLVTGSSDWYPQIGGCERPFLRQTVWSKRNEFSNIVYNSGNNRKKRSFNTLLMLGSTYRAGVFFNYSRATNDAALCKSVMFKVECFSTVQVILLALIQGFNTVQIIRSALIQGFNTM